MKIRHRVPTHAYRSDPVSPEYQAEVDRHTDKAMAAWRRAQGRLAAAEKRLARVRKSVSPSRARVHEVAVAAELVEARREELQRIERLMKAVPAAAQHRGTQSYRPVPQPGGQV